MYAAYKRTSAEVKFHTANRRADSGVTCVRAALEEYTLALNEGRTKFCTAFSEATAPTSKSHLGSKPEGTTSASANLRQSIVTRWSGSKLPTSAQYLAMPAQPLAAFVPAPDKAPPDLKPYRLNGTQDMLELFELMPLYDRAVRPYLRPDPAAPGATPSSDPGSVPARPETESKRATLPKTFVHYVEDLPGKVRPPKRSGAAKHQPKELTQLLMKPEYTYTPIVPFDADTLSHAFHVEPASTPAPGIDTSLLDADEHESPMPKKQKNTAQERQEPPKKRVVLLKKKRTE